MKLWVVAGALALWCAPTAQAAPPNFPDLDFFTPTTDTHLAQYQGGTQQVVKFSTPDGVYCSINVLGGVGPTIRCYGAVPGIAGVAVTTDPYVAKPCDFGVADLHAAREGVLSSMRGTCPTDLAGAAVLLPGEKVTVRSTTCGVAPGSVTACIDNTDGGHGFVLQPSGSWAF